MMQTPVQEPATAGPPDGSLAGLTTGFRHFRPNWARLGKGLSRRLPWPPKPEEAPMSKHYDTLETRTPAEREKALMQALPQQIAHAKANAPVLQGMAEGRRSRRGDLARGAGQIAGAAQIHAGRGAEEESADGRPDRRPDEQGAPCLHVARSDLRDRHRRARLFPWRAGDACRGLPAGPRRLQHLLLSPDARRPHDGIGACARWAAPSCRAVSATPSCSSTPSPASSPIATSARRHS